MFDFEYMLAIHSFLFIFMLLVQSRQTSGAVAGSIGVCIAIARGVPLSSTFRGGYLSTFLYQTANWGLIGIEQDLSQGWTHDADGCAKLLAGL